MSHDENDAIEKRRLEHRAQMQRYQSARKPQRDATVQRQQAQQRLARHGASIVGGAVGGATEYSNSDHSVARAAIMVVGLRCRIVGQMRTDHP